MELRNDGRVARRMVIDLTNLARLADGSSGVSREIIYGLISGSSVVTEAESCYRLGPRELIIHVDRGMEVTAMVAINQEMFSDHSLC